MYVAVVLLVCSAQAVLIALFVTERKKRLAVQTVLERKTLDQQRIESELEQSRLFIERLASAIPSVLFVYDLAERRNVYVNEASSRVIGYSAQEVMDMGDRFITQLMHPDDLASLPQLTQSYQERPSGAVFENVFRMKHRNGEWRWVHRFATVLLTTPDGKPLQLIGTATDITELERTQAELKHLSSKLLHVLEDERQRISRELHDITAQNLFVMSMNLTNVQESGALPARLKASLDECQNLCDQALQEVRTLSYLLHPTLLDKVGLVSTLRSYLQSLAKRSGIQMQLETTESTARLPLEVESDLFLVVREALANAVRHSGGDRVVVSFYARDNQATLKILDNGRGMKPGAPVGIGIRSMQERVKRMNGEFEILSGNQGTTVSVTIPQCGEADSGGETTVSG
jgi:PAS domain S-box-containing protein